jgi:hypothetical protein
MNSVLQRLLFCVALVAGCGILVYSQPPDMPDATTSSPRGRRSEEAPKGLSEMLARQRLDRDKKDYEEMLDRGEEALKLANQLETSFEQNKAVSQQDRARLEALEKVVTRIRKELGADDDAVIGGKDDGHEYMPQADEPKPSTVEEAVGYLQSTTAKLVDELKKTTRFSVSVVAIQTSNTALKLVRFLRLKK